MRRVIVLVTVGTMFLALTAGIALAATISCDGGTCTGTPKSDVMNGSASDDYMDGLGGDDTMTGSGGSDRIYGSRGNDTINADDGIADYVNCGAGKDTVDHDGNDTVIDCEHTHDASS